MRILHIIPSLNTGGAERLTLDMCRELQRQGHEVKLVIAREVNHYPALSKEVDWKFLPVHVRPSVLNKWDINLEPLNQFIKSFRPEIIHSHLFEAEILSRENLHEGIRYFTHCHDNMPQFRNLSFETLFDKTRLTNFYEKQHLLQQYSKCDNRFIAISQDTQVYFQETLPASLSKNISLLNNAIDFKRFNAFNHTRETDAIRIVNVGSFVAKKNQQLLVEIVNELVKQRQNVKCVMLGDGPLLAEVKQKIADYGLKEVIECKGNVETVEDYLAEANIYVHTAIYEPFGLVLLEAMAAGLPVISLDGKGNRDIMVNYAKECLLQKADAKEFAIRILTLFNASARYKTMVQKSVTTSQRYDIHNYVAELTDLYQQR